MNREPPAPGTMIQILVRAVDRAARWPRSVIWGATAAGLAAAMTIDLLTNVQVSLFLFYLLVAAFAAWCLGQRVGFAVTVVIAMIATAIRHHQMALAGHHTPLGIEAWNVVTRTLNIGLFVVVTAGLRAMIALERWRAATDGLTGALNKRAFLQQMRDKVRDAEAAGGTIVLCYMDLDGFKQVNDRHGHAAGDEVLTTFASNAAAMIRDTDLFARVGGDEFAALLAAPSREEGDRLAEMVHARLGTVLADTGFGVTLSMGALVETGRLFAAQDDLVVLADRLMYEAKRSGKDALRIGRLSPVTPVPIAPSPRIRVRRKVAA